MITIIRIHGKPKIKICIDETLNRLRLRRKFACVVIDEKDKVKIGMLKSVKEYVAYGKISEEVYKKLVEKRGHKVDGKLKPFFRLHPPIGGFKKSTKLMTPKGILGEHKDISKLLLRML